MNDAIKDILGFDDTSKAESIIHKFSENDIVLNTENNTSESIIHQLTESDDGDPTLAENIIHAVGSIDQETFDELTHWGVLGMKWGVRKPRNSSKRKTASDDPDKFKGVDKGKHGENVIQPKASTVSKASTKSIQDKNNRRAVQQRNAINNAYVIRKQKKKSLARMSDADLARTLERLRQEQAYKELSTSKMDKLLSEIGREVTKKQIVRLLDTGLNKALPALLSGVANKAGSTGSSAKKIKPPQSMPKFKQRRP